MRSFTCTVYGVSRTEKDYQLFEQFMQVPMGDAKARRELMQSDPSMSVAHEGFIEGRNHPDDIDGMISLFVDFSNVSYIKKAIAIWGDAQAIATQLLPISQALHEQIVSPHPSQAKIDELLATIYNINEKLTSYEDDFSFTLGEGSRWLERICTQAAVCDCAHCRSHRAFLSCVREQGDT